MRLTWDLLADGCWYATAPDSSVWRWSRNGAMSEITGRHKPTVAQEDAVRRNAQRATDLIQPV